MFWLEQASRLCQQASPFVIVTVAKVRGHAPRDAGAKMIVRIDETFGSVGGGNLEQVATERAREMLASACKTPALLTVTLNPESGDYGVQCCGGEVSLLLEPVNLIRATVAIFGAGHVGLALVQVLSILPVDLHLIDSRKSQLDKLSTLTVQAASTLKMEHAPIPETALADLHEGSHILVMTHDHAEDIAILERALRRDDLGYIGLIGSSAKWAHFQRELKAQGHSAEVLGRVTTPIGLPGVPGKSPQAIAIATAAQLLAYLDLPEDHV